MLLREQRDGEAVSLSARSAEDRGRLRRGDIVLALAQGSNRALTARASDVFAPLAVQRAGRKALEFSYDGQQTHVEMGADCVGAERGLYFLVVESGFLAYSVHLPLAN